MPINDVRNNRNTTQNLTVYLMSKYLEGKYLPYLCCLGLSLCREGVDHTATLIHAPECLHSGEVVPGLKGKGGVKKEGKGIKAPVLFPSFPSGKAAHRKTIVSLSWPLIVLPCVTLWCLWCWTDILNIPIKCYLKKRHVSHSFCRCGP